MQKKSIKPEKRLSKRELRRRKYEEVRKKQLDTAYKYPFCRRCKEPLDPKWAKKQKKAGQLPLCEICFPAMMELYKKNIALWAKFNKR